MPNKQKLKVLFLCTGNSCRSQMAEGWARALKGDVIEAYSAGIEAHGLNPCAVKVMAEAGVDITGQRSKKVDEMSDIPLDVIITVCGQADESCPAWLGEKARVNHVGFDDPPKLARTAATEDEALAHYRRVRDEIRDLIIHIELKIANWVTLLGIKDRGASSIRQRDRHELQNGFNVYVPPIWTLSIGAEVGISPIQQSGRFSLRDTRHAPTLFRWCL